MCLIPSFRPTLANRPLIELVSRLALHMSSLPRDRYQDHYGYWISRVGFNHPYELPDKPRVRSQVWNFFHWLRTFSEQSRWSRHDRRTCLRSGVENAPEPTCETQTVALRSFSYVPRGNVATYGATDYIS